MNQDTYLRELATDFLDSLGALPPVRERFYVEVISRAIDDISASESEGDMQMAARILQANAIRLLLAALIAKDLNYDKRNH